MSLESEAALLQVLREHLPEANAREAHLLDRLMGAMGMVRTLTKKRGSSYMVGGKDAYADLDAWLDATYQLKIRWPREEP